MDKEKIIRLFEESLNELDTIVRFEDLAYWQNKWKYTIEAIYGKNSTQYNDFQSLYLYDLEDLFEEEGKQDCSRGIKNAKNFLNGNLTLIKQGFISNNLNLSNKNKIENKTNYPVNIVNNINNTQYQKLSQISILNIFQEIIPNDTLKNLQNIVKSEEMKK